MSVAGAIQSISTHADAARLLDDVHTRPTVVAVSRACRSLDELAAAIPHVLLKLACLSSFTFDPLVPAVRVAALRAGIRVDPWVAPFDQIAPTLIEAGGALDAAKPDVVLIAARLADLVPELYDGFASTHDTELHTRVMGSLDQLDAAVRTFRHRSNATVLLQGFERPDFITAGLAELDAPGGQIDLWKTAQARLNAITESAGNGYVMDYDALVARHGRHAWADPRMEQFGRIPIAAQSYWHYAMFVVRHLRPLVGRTKKVIVLDADNTLWGGILGDDGADGIQLGHDFPGNAFVRFQRRLLALQQRGIVLCIASKNEPGSVESVVESHPEMALRPEHFACMQVNWQPKPDNLRRIAETLNLGLDSFVFLDDSAVECAMMREALPEVMTVQMPEDFTLYPRLVESLDCFAQFHLSDEDRKRGAMYRAEAQRKTLETQTLDLPSFYRSLEMQLTLAVDDERRVARAAQMTQRTNQFNMTTIRCTEDDIRAWMQAGDHEVITLGLTDRFGDSGVVGLAVVRKEDAVWQLHLLLMSCRVLGRTVETTFIRWVAQRARMAGATQLIGRYDPTTKNRPFGDFYRKCGFTASPDAAEGGTWVLNLDSADTTIPDWFAVETEAPAPR